jgi:hypothetical protein
MRPPIPSRPPLHPSGGLIRDIGRRRDVLDGIANLHAAGLLHRTSDGFVFASRAAIYLDRLDM